MSLGNFVYFMILQYLLLLPKICFYYFVLFTHLSGHHGATQKINWTGGDGKFSLSLSHMVEKVHSWYYNI